MNFIPLIFEYNDKFNYPRKIGLTCSYKDKFSDIIEQYRLKSENYYKNEKFIYIGQAINPMYTVAELDNAPDSIIKVIQYYQVKGGGLAMEYTGVSKNNILELGLSKMFFHIDETLKE